MICLTCRCEIPENQLVCEACLENKAWAQVMEQQVLYLARASTGSVPVCFYKLHASSMSHLVLYGFSDRAFCRRRLPNVRNSQRYEKRYADLNLHLGCTTCRDVLNLLRPVRECESRRGMGTAMKFDQPEKEK